MMPMDSASSRFRCCDSVCWVWISGVMRASCGQRHGIQGPARDEEGVAESGLAISERRAPRREYLAARCREHRVPGGRVPLHGGAEARVEVGLTGGQQTELQRRADGDPLANLVLLQVGF